MSRAGVPPVTRRFLAIMSFALGVLLLVAFGCVLAAYDIWGGVPRGLVRPMGAVAAVGALLVVVGAVQWVLAFPPGKRLRVALLSGAAVAVLAIGLGGGLFSYYAVRLDTSTRICQPARKAPLRATRDAALSDGLGPLFPVIDPSFECIEMKRELDELDKSGTCPEFVLNDAPCTCGKQRWTKTSTPCATAPTTCQWRSASDRSELGCAEGEAAR